jgi:hypothetical protein
VSIPEGYAGGDEDEPGRAGAGFGWRDVCAAWLVHAGLALATPDARNRILHVLADEWRAAVGRALSMSRHPAGSARSDGARPPVHLADRMDAARRVQQRAQRRGRSTT